MKLFGFLLPYGDHDLDHDHHNKLSFECPSCGKDFSSPQALDGHPKAHKAERKLAKRVQIIRTRPSNPPPAPSPNNRHHHHHHDQGFGLAARFQRVSPWPVSAADASHFALIGSSSGPSSIFHYGPIRARRVSHHVGGGVLTGSDRVIYCSRPHPYAVIRGQGSGGDQDHDYHHDHIDRQLRLAPSNSNWSNIYK